MKKFFITGTDTGVGKTLVSAILTAVMEASYWKPIQSGVADEISEEEKVKNLIHLDEKKIIDPVYTLQASLSPDQAADLEQIKIDLDKINLPNNQDGLIVEGAGGVFVPINTTQSMLDVMQKFQLPIIIVARGTLGTINHTLLTIEALRKRNLFIHGVVFSGELNVKNRKTIETWGQVVTLFHVPYFPQINREIVAEWLLNYAAEIKEGLVGTLRFAHPTFL